MDVKVIGKKIKSIRESKGISQKELASKLNISWEMVSRYENARSNPLQRIVEIANILSVSLNALILDDMSITKQNKNDIPYLIKLDNVMDLKAQLQNFEVYYKVPDWVVSKFDEIFALKLNNIVNDTDLKLNTEDVGIFSLDIRHKYKYYLFNSNLRSLKQEPLKPGCAGLIYVELRVYQR